jgi:signal peptidase II
MLRKRLGYLIIAAAVILSHQMAQWLVFPAVAEHGGPIAVLSFFNLVEVWNPGISFGMFNDLTHGQWLLSALALAITFILLRWLWRTHDKFTSIALALVIGGAVGNTVDRLRYGAVADYLDFHAFGYHWPAFNITDTAICIGVIMLMLPLRKTKAAGSISVASR